MISFIICEDNQKDMDNVVSIVKEFARKNNIDYKMYLFNDYDNDFNSIIHQKLPFKIYLLDIETPSSSGIDKAREIRKIDIDSVITFLTSHEELGNVILKNDLMYLSFINKFDNFKNKLNKSL